MDFHNTKTLCIIGGSEDRGDGDIRLVKTQVNGGTNNIVGTAIYVKNMIVRNSGTAIVANGFMYADANDGVVRWITAP